MPNKIVKAIKFDVESSAGTVTDLTKYFMSTAITDGEIEIVYLPLSKWERFKRWIKHKVRYV